MPPLLDDANRRTFERYRLMARRVRAGAMKGDRRSSKRGSSLEFADYRPYTTGDDLRRLDWKVYARTERAVVKLFDDEEDLAVHLWVDTSASMGFPTEGNPDHHKLTYAKRLAAALACIALNENDSLTLTVGGLSRTFRGRARLGEVLQHLTHAEANGQTDLDRALSDYAKNGRRFAPDGRRDRPRPRGQPRRLATRAVPPALGRMARANRPRLQAPRGRRGAGRHPPTL
ncbi:MAG: DUF58 domain-containing protein [Anaerolineae bacterium]|nr:DUF58 domain-containing protein [Anaerolineae bacterium]